MTVKAITQGFGAASRSSCVLPRAFGGRTSEAVVGLFVKTGYAACASNSITNWTQSRKHSIRSWRPQADICQVAWFASRLLGLEAKPLLQCFDMTDWRQIQARIRKAKNSPDALTKLSELFQRTRDGMVAWELGSIEEKSERTSEAVKWYSVAAERFRRAEWKKKAEEALVRLGAPVPVSIHQPHHEESGENDSGASPESHEEESATREGNEMPLRSAQPLAYGEIPEAEHAEAQPPMVNSASAPSPVAGNASSGIDPQKRKRRRGRRGGRGRRRKDVAAPSLPTQAFAESLESQDQPPRLEPSAPLPVRHPESQGAPVGRPAPVSPRPAAMEASLPAPQLPSERTAHGRAGDPALASRMAHLESMLRRLLSSPLRRLDDVDQAPAGPGVFLLSDSDQVTSYYIEACQTLRVGLGNLLRGGRGAKPSRGGRTYPESNLKSKLAEHLEINESKVGQYMKDHCVVRWIQLDDEAAHLAHFAIGVLRTPLNLD